MNPRDLIGASLIGLGVVMFAPWIWFGVWFRRVAPGLPYGFDLRSMMEGLQAMGLIAIIPMAAGVWLLVADSSK